MAPRILPILSTLDDIAEAIASPPSRRPFAEAVGNAGRRICDRRSANPGAGGYGGALGAAVDTMCGPYWEENGYSPPSSESPFTGGQCAGASYNLSYSTFTVTIADCIDPSFTVTQNITGGVFAENIIGPIQSITTVLDTPGPCGPRFLRARVVTPAIDLLFPITNVGSASVIISGSPSYSVSRNDGPDNCGDPEPIPIPGPDPAPDPGPIPPGDDVFDDPITGPMLPIPELPNFPFRNPFRDRGTGDPPGDPGEPGESVPADGIGGGGAGAEAEGTAPPGSELVALRLDLIDVLPNFPDVGNGDYRAAAFIRMGTVAGLDLDLGGAIVRDGQLFYAEKEGLTKWSVTANVGISWLVTPFYREVN